MRAKIIATLVVASFLILTIFSIDSRITKTIDTATELKKEHEIKYPYIARLDGKNYYFHSSKVEDNKYFFYDEDMNLIIEFIVSNESNVVIMKR